MEKGFEREIKMIVSFLDGRVSKNISCWEVREGKGSWADVVTHESKPISDGFLHL